MKKHIIGILVAVCLMIVAVPAASVFAEESTDAISPAGTTMVSPGSVTGFKATLKWNASEEDIYGYEVSYSVNSDFSSASEFRIEGPEVCSKTVEKLQPATTYYTRVRTIKYVNGVKYYSDWSPKKSFKTKNTGWYHALCLKSKTGYKGQGSIYSVSLSGSTLTVKAKWNTGSTKDIMLMKPVKKPYCTTKFKLTSSTKYYTSSGNAGLKKSTKSYVLKVMKSSSGLSCIMQVKDGKVLSIRITS